MELQYRLQSDTLFVPMPSEVDHHAVQSMNREIDFLIGSWHVKKLVFDFADTEFMDSSVVGMMIGRSRTMQMYRGEIYAINLGERARQIFCRSGLDQLISTDYSEDCEQPSGMGGKK